MKNQQKTNIKQDKDGGFEPWETRMSLGSYLKRLSNGGAKDVPHVEKTGLDPGQGKPDR
jgi:hypothetical protein